MHVSLMLQPTHVELTTVTPEQRQRLYISRSNLPCTPHTSLSASLTVKRYGSHLRSNFACRREGSEQSQVERREVPIRDDKDARIHAKRIVL